ncbi:MAG: Cif family virulence factor [Desulfobaccales bacterium]
MTDKPKSAFLQRWLGHSWLRGLGLGLGLVLVGLLLWFFIQGRAFFTVSEKGNEALPVQAQPAPGTAAAPPSALNVPPAPASVLKSQLEQVLAGIREANRKRDLSQLLSYYSPNFPQLTQRAQSISKTWKIYNYPKMEFDIQEVKLLDDNMAVARVTWLVEAQNISTMKQKTIARTYLITFARESGQWRISALDKAE